MTKIEMPNGLQWHNEKLYVIDQKTDNIFILDEKGQIIDEFSTLCENGSGITIGDNCIWLAQMEKQRLGHLEAAIHILAGY